MDASLNCPRAVGRTLPVAHVAAPQSRHARTFPHQRGRRLAEGAPAPTCNSMCTSCATSCALRPPDRVIALAMRPAGAQRAQPAQHAALSSLPALAHRTHLTCRRRAAAMPRPCCGGQLTVSCPARIPKRHASGRDCIQDYTCTLVGPPLAWSDAHCQLAPSLPPLPRRPQAFPHWRQAACKHELWVRQRDIAQGIRTRVPAAGLRDVPVVSCMYAGAAHSDLPH